MDKNEVSLNDSSVGGKVTGRDDNSITFHSTYEQSKCLEKLYNDYQRELETNTELQEMCEELNYYHSQVGDDFVIGLENKLTAGNRQSILKYAQETKERFHKKLIRNSQYSLIAQEVNVHILAKVRRSFMMDVYTLICNNESDEKINIVIEERIIKPVKAELGINIFKYNEEDIMGMIFFLTGNCHLKWTK